jgi:hypothetical protein
MNLLEEIQEKIKDKYNGMLICENQRANLFVYIDGKEEEIESIDMDTIYFINDYHTTKLIDSDIQHLVYINNSI